MREKGRQTCPFALREVAGLNDSANLANGLFCWPAKRKSAPKSATVQRILTEVRFSRVMIRRGDRQACLSRTFFYTKVMTYTSTPSCLRQQDGLGFAYDVWENRDALIDAFSSDLLRIYAKCAPN